jgi:hypothetical protein
MEMSVVDDDGVRWNRLEKFLKVLEILRNLTAVFCNVSNTSQTCYRKG